MRRLVIAALFVGLGCAGPAPKAAGEACFATSECGAGLLCDFGQSPALCAGEGTGGNPADAAPPGADGGNPADAAPPGMPDAAQPDASQIDAAIP